MINRVLYDDAVALLRALIRVPSFSRQESETARIIEEWLRNKLNNCDLRSDDFCVDGENRPAIGLEFAPGKESAEGAKKEDGSTRTAGENEVYRHGNNVWVRNLHFDPSKPTILLCSHHDTVRPSEAWTRDPFDAAIERDAGSGQGVRQGVGQGVQQGVGQGDGECDCGLGGARLYGLGSNDAGASAVSLAAAFRHFYDRNELKYNLILALVGEEEISGSGGVRSILPLLGLGSTGRKIGKSEIETCVADGTGGGVNGGADGCAGGSAGRGVYCGVDGCAGGGADGFVDGCAGGGVGGGVDGGAGGGVDCGTSVATVSGVLSCTSATCESDTENQHISLCDSGTYLDNPAGTTPLFCEVYRQSAAARKASSHESAQPLASRPFADEIARPSTDEISRPSAGEIARRSADEIAQIAATETGTSSSRKILEQSLQPPAQLSDFAIVGEPTGMQLAIAEKGLLVLDCVSRGRAGHAARDEGDNAIYHAIKDIEWFRSYRFPLTSPLFGQVKMSVTMISAGTQHNVVPAECSFTVDCRVTERYTNEEVLSTVRQHVTSTVTPRSLHLRSSSISVDHPVVRAGMSLGMSTFGSPTTSDQVALTMIPSVKVGPGQSSRSHSGNEYILLSEIEEGIDLYIRILEHLL